MKSPTLNIQATVAALALSVIAAHAAPPSITAAAKAAPAKTSAAPVNHVVDTKSEFSVPGTIVDGRDPFFPDSTRPFAVEAVAKTTADTSLSDIEFALRGISGTAEHPLAIINGYNFGAGEENEVIIKSKRIKIRCTEINMTAGTVLIECGGSRRQLRL